MASRLGLASSSVEPGGLVTDGSPSGVGAGAFSRRENAGSVPPTFEGEGLYWSLSTGFPSGSEVAQEGRSAGAQPSVEARAQGKRESASYAVVERPRSCPSSILKSRKRSDERALSRFCLLVRGYPVTGKQGRGGASETALWVLPGSAHRSSPLRWR